MIEIIRGLNRSDVGICNDCQDRNEVKVNEISLKSMRFRLCDSCLSELEEALEGGKNAGK